MPWWVFLIVAVTAYVAGFLIIGAVLAHTMKPTVRRVDLVSAMIFWPFFGPCYGVYRAALAYVESLEGTLAKRRVPKVTKLPTPRVVDYSREGWETRE